MLKNGVFLLFLVMSTYGFSQEDFIIGKLIDSDKNESLPFATIRIKNKALGVISNVDGTFKIPFRFREMGETIEISCLGYVSKEISMERLEVGLSNTITLKPGGLILDEAVVSAKIKNLSPEKIVRIAVNSITQNYSSDAFGLVGYYRDYQVKNGSYTNLNEAVIKTKDKGFEINNNLKNEYELYSYILNNDFEIDSFARQPYDYDGFNKVVPNARMSNDGGNEFITLITHDPIRNHGLELFSFVDDIRTDFLKRHTFLVKRKIQYGQEKVYEISLIFQNDHYLATGTIFINTDDYAIHKFDYALYKLINSSDTNLAVNADERFSDGFKKMKSELLYRIQTEYDRYLDQKMFLNYISFYNKVLIQRPAPFRSKFTLNLADNSFRVLLNKIPSKLEKIKNNDFKVTYKGDEIPIKEFYFLEDERTFVLCPNLGYKYVKERLDDLFTAKDGLEVEGLDYSYRDILDNQGNVLDERKWEYIHQYREFFTQEIQIESEPIDESELMIKSRPLDSPEQPISSGVSTNGYWKNTPLKGSID